MFVYFHFLLLFIVAVAMKNQQQAAHELKYNVNKNITAKKNSEISAYHFETHLINRDTQEKKRSRRETLSNGDSDNLQLPETDNSLTNERANVDAKIMENVIKYNSVLLEKIEDNHNITLQEISLNTKTLDSIRKEIQQFGEAAEINKRLLNESIILREIMDAHYKKQNNQGQFIDILNQIIKHKDAELDYKNVEFDALTKNMKELISTVEVLKRTVKIQEMRAKKDVLLKYFGEISGSKTIAGLHYLQVGVNEEDHQMFHNVSGKYPGLIRIDIPATSDGLLEWQSFIDDAIDNWNNGQLVKIFWDFYCPLSYMEVFVDNSDTVDGETKWLQLIEDGTTLNKEWKLQLDILAGYLQKLQVAGVVPLLDILNKINSKYLIWRGRPGVNGTAKLYKITHDYLTKKHNLTSLIWTWSLWNEDMPLMKEFWPGGEYVDVASVFMWDNKEIPRREYLRLLDVVGDKPISMDCMHTVPTRKLLAAQPKWTWFSLCNEAIKNETYNNANQVKETFNTPSVIYEGDITFFNNTN